MARMSALLIGMESVALVVAYLAFGWPVLLPGAPVLVGTAVVLLAVCLAERRRAARVQAVAPTGREPVQPGLMSGFFRVPAQPGTPEVPVAAPGPAAR